MLVVVPLVVTVGVIVIIVGVIATVCYIRFSLNCSNCLNSHITSTLVMRRRLCSWSSVILCYYFTL